MGRLGGFEKHTSESGRRSDHERPQWQGQLAECRKAGGRAPDAHEAESQTSTSAEEGSLDSAIGRESAHTFTARIREESYYRRSLGKLAQYILYFFSLKSNMHRVSGILTVS